MSGKTSVLSRSCYIFTFNWDCGQNVLCSCGTDSIMPCSNAKPLLRNISTFSFLRPRNYFIKFSTPKTALFRTRCYHHYHCCRRICLQTIERAAAYLYGTAHRHTMRTSIPTHSVLSVNKGGGHFQNGKPYDVVKKYDVASIYEKLKKGKGVGGSVSQRELACAASVSKTFATKIIDEVESGGLIDPNTVKHARSTMVLGPRHLISMTKCFS
jgi:hypothetical protein